MRTDTIIKDCPIHGKVEHGVYEYSYSIYPSTICLTCVREKRRLRRKDPEKNAHDLEYTKEWLKKAGGSEYSPFVFLFFP